MLTLLLAWGVARAEPADALDPMARRLWDEAVRLEAEGRFAPAALRYRAVHQLDPEWSQAEVALGRVLAADERGDEAERVWGALPYDADAVEALGRHLLERGAAAEAAAAFHRLRDLRPDWPGTRVLEAKAVLGADPEAAALLLHDYLQFGGIRPEEDGLDEVTLAVGDALRLAGNRAGARALVDEVLARRPEASAVLGPLVEELEVDELADELTHAVDAPLTPVQLATVREAKRDLGAGDVAAARRRLEVLVVEQPLSAVAWSTLAQVRLADEDPVGSEAALRAALHLDPLDVEQITALARLLSDAYGGRFDAEAAELWARATRRRPEDPELWYQRAQAERRAGRPEAFVSCLRQVSALDPHGAHAEEASRALRGATLARTGPPALPGAPGRPASVPEAAWVAFHRAVAWRELGGTAAADRALAEVATARAGAPRFVPALDLESAIRLDAGEVDAAASLLEQALALDPGRGDLAWRLASLRELQGRGAEAGELRRAASELGDADALWWRARAEADAWRWWSARESLAAYFDRSTGGPDWERARALDRDLVLRAKTAAAVAAATVAAAVALPWIVWRRRRAGGPLSDLIERAPDSAHEVAAACAVIRHEVLKHHLGTLAAVADALDDRDPEPARWAAERWFGPEGALARMDRTVAELEALGRRVGVPLRLRDDPDFGPMLRAADALRRLEPRLRRGHGRALADDLRALAGPLGRDAHRALGRVVEGLSLLRVDRALIEEIAARTVAEFDGARVPRIEVVAGSEELWVRMFRPPLEDLLGNLLRNAIDAAPAAAAVAVSLGVREDWVTGLEQAEIAVVDQAPGELTTEQLRSRVLSRGLGLVVDLAARAGGSVRVEPRSAVAGASDGPWRKAVVVSLPRVERSEEGG